MDPNFGNMGTGGVMGGEVRAPRKFRLCLQIDSVCENKHLTRKTSAICILREEKDPTPPPTLTFPPVADNRAAFPFQLTRPPIIAVITISLTEAASRSSINAALVPLQPVSKTMQRGSFQMWI